MDDEEHFYDSLEESSQSESPRFEIQPEFEKPSSRTYRTRIPVYTGFLNKSHKANLLFKHEQNNDITSNIFENRPTSQPVKNDNKVPVKKDSLRAARRLLLERQRRKNSYLGMFKAKMDYSLGNCDKSDSLSSKSVFGDLTPRSQSKVSTRRSSWSMYATQDPAWETASSYVNYMITQPDLSVNKPNVTVAKLTVAEIPDASYIETCNNSGNDSEVDKIMSNLHSVSEIYFQKKEAKPKQKIMKCTIEQYRQMQSTTLGGLGPDLSTTKHKMDRLKRQQEYGMKASIRNRARIMGRSLQLPTIN